MKQGVLLINLGTPTTDNYISVFRYLREFLSDPRVISLPSLLRYTLLYGVILPFRTHKTLHAYKSIWTKDGSPLRCYSEQIKSKLQKALGDQFIISLGMRYGEPSITKALDELSSCTKVTVLPLFPHYSSAATGSALEAVLKIIARQNNIPALNIIREFYSHASFINAISNKIAPYLAAHDFVLFSYHGLPVQHLKNAGCETICTTECPNPLLNNPSCYRAQCYTTTKLVAQNLALKKNQYTTSFQSRLGRTPWITPYTDEILIQLYNQGIRNLAIFCPSFVVDCLETLEEMGMQIKHQWEKIGGNKCTLIPCLNTDVEWMLDLFK